MVPYKFKVKPYLPIIRYLVSKIRLYFKVLVKSKAGGWHVKGRVTQKGSKPLYSNIWWHGKHSIKAK